MKRLPPDEEATVADEVTKLLSRAYQWGVADLKLERPASNRSQVTFLDDDGVYAVSAIPTKLHRWYLRRFLILAGIDGERVRTGTIRERIADNTFIEAALEVTGTGELDRAEVRLSLPNRQPPSERLLWQIMLSSLKKGARAFRIEPRQVVFLIDEQKLTELNPPRTIHDALMRRIGVIAGLPPDTDGETSITVQIGADRLERFLIRIEVVEGARVATMFRYPEGLAKET